MSASHAVSTARAIILACRLAARSAPSVGMSRVLTSPATGAFARMATATSALAVGIAVAPGKRRRLGAEEEGEPQAPHQDDRAQHAVRLPAPARGGHARREA